MGILNGYTTLRWAPGMYDAPKSGGYVYEHREVAGAMLGRPLSTAENVHHEDENRANNNPSNLYVFRTTADHIRFHRTGVRINMGDGTWTSPPVPGQCEQCGATTSKARSTRCASCAHAATRLTVPPADELRTLVWAMPTTAVAEQYGVSDVTVANWCKALGIEKPQRGYWSKRAAQL